MKIVDARVIVTCPGRNFVTLKITTADGVTCWGDATLNGRELSVASYLKDHVAPLLIGRDPARIVLYTLLGEVQGWSNGTLPEDDTTLIVAKAL